MSSLSILFLELVLFLFFLFSVETERDFSKVSAAVSHTEWMENMEMKMTLWVEELRRSRFDADMLERYIYLLNQFERIILTLKIHFLLISLYIWMYACCYTISDVQ